MTQHHFKNQTNCLYVHSKTITEKGRHECGVNLKQKQNKNTQVTYSYTVN